MDESITREWVLNVGQRSAIQRLGHLICEMFVRLRAVGLTEGTSFEFPVIQAELADTTGLSVVHANRTLQELRENGLIVWKGRRLTILDLSRLTELSMFNPNYLHLEGEGNEPGSRANHDAG